MMDRLPPWLPAAAIVLLVAWNAGPRLWPAFAAPRYFDETFALANARITIEGEWPRVDNAFYLATCYLPVAGLWWVLEHAGYDVSELRYTNRRALTAARLWSVAYALASLLVLERLGRGLGGGRWLGFWAAAVLSAFPRHVHSGHQVKPDILVMFWTLVAAQAAVTAARRPSVSAYLRSGMAASLAFGAKITGFSAGLPILAVALASLRRHPRRLLWLALAGAASIALFLVANPYPGHLIQAMGVVKRDYRVRGRFERMDHAEMGERLWGFLLEGHGLLLGAAVLGLGFWLWRAAGRASGDFAPAGPDARPVALALLAVPLGHCVVHTLATTLFRGQNVIAIIPFTSLAAACALVWAARASTARWGRAARWAWTAGGALLLAWLAARPWLIAARDVART